MSASTWYKHTPDAAAVPPQVAERALEWLVELQAQPDAETVAAWQRWRAAHADHERAWQRIESVRGRLQPLASPVSSAIAQAALAPRGSARRRQIVKTLAVTLFAGGAVWGAAELTPWREWNADYRTAIGERRTLVLADGTQLMLNTASAANIAYGAAERRIRLLGGELLATTAKDAAARPFLIETAHGAAHALGTRYAVRLAGDATEVRVFEGAVRLEPRHGAAAVVLPAGQQARFSATDIGTVSAADLAAIGWTDGFIIAHGMRLDDFLAELGRYSRDHLSCDPAVAALRVSGSFPVADVGRVLDTVAGTLALRAEVRERFWGARHVRLSLAANATASVRSS
ncbi:FecR domain-containing protein [Herbaspirillum sp. LeCh32-8]|uniref:FecR domain-containing protein n=1 Tax=Herbaspirillum sp. LeCh32-8 TaxID=2821356 RepID=UPI001AEA6C03|nr:FecR domain-containing protein [Herbaspirillum sp. LeCh32-8]MBP0599010.1 FecR domain-containing protein [Herbaspirillum sp. LeCh32-8]